MAGERLAVFELLKCIMPTAMASLIDAYADTSNLAFLTASGMLVSGHAPEIDTAQLLCAVLAMPATFCVVKVVVTTRGLLVLVTEGAGEFVKLAAAVVFPGVMYYYSVLSNLVPRDDFVAQVYGPEKLLVWIKQMAWLVGVENDKLHATKINTLSTGHSVAHDFSYVVNQWFVEIRQVVPLEDGTFGSLSSGCIRSSSVQSKFESEFEVSLPAHHVAHCVLGPQKWLLLVSSADDMALAGLVLTPQDILQTFSVSLESKLVAVAAQYNSELGKGVVVCLDEASAELSFRFHVADERLVLSPRVRRQGTASDKIEVSARLLVCKTRERVAGWRAWLDGDEHRDGQGDLLDVFHCDPACLPMLQRLSEIR